MAKALITGAGGFVGGYLADALREAGDTVAGFLREEDAVNGMKGHPVDIRNAEAVSEAVAEESPDEIYHLAAIAHPAAEEGLRTFYDVNVAGTVNVLEAAEAVGASVLLVSSAYVYRPRDAPLSEADPVGPVTHYGASKAGSELAAVPYVTAGLRVIRVRPFNHTGPGQTARYLVPSLVRQLVRIEKGLSEPVLELGNMDSVRDFTDVRDVVRAYPALLRRGEAGGVYNLASGKGRSVRELLDRVLGHTDVKPEVRVQERRVRATDIPFLVGNAERLRSEIGWKPRHDLDETLRAMFERDRQQSKEVL